MSDDMRLYYAESLSPRKACAVARHVGATVDYVFVDLAKGEQRSEAFEQINPNCKVPVLVDGAEILWESNAIMCRLAQQSGSALWPNDTGQADVIRWLVWDAVQFSRYGGELYFLHLIGPHIGLGAPDPAQVREAQDAFRASARILNDHLALSDWVTGTVATIADFALGASLPYADEAAIPFGEFRQIRDWYARLNGLPGWAEPFPSR